MEEGIQKLLNRIYCDNCRFQEGTEEEWEDKLGYYGCSDCNRKQMGWEPSEYTIRTLIDIVKQG